MTKTQSRVSYVLTKLSMLANEEEYFAEALSDDLENLLDGILGQDGFGTEGQTDPRGDMRESVWSMHHVQGIDE